MPDTATAVASAPDTGSTASTTSAAPTTFAEAFARDDSPTSQTSESSTTPPAAAQPGTEPSSPQHPDDRSPFIPRARFDEVNNNLRELKAWKEQRAWAEQVQPEQFREMQTWFQRAAQDPVAFTEQLIQDLNAHPVHSQALRSLAAKALASGRGQAPATMPEPDVAITDGNGQVVGMTYSEKGLAARDAFLTQQILAKVNEQYAPVAQTYQDVKAEREQLQMETAANKWRDGFTKEMSTEYQGFTENKQAIGQEVVRILKQYSPDDPRTNDQAFLEAVTLRAYHKVVGPLRAQAAQSQVLDSLQQKAGAAATVNPGSAAPSSPANITSFNDPRLAW